MSLLARIPKHLQDKPFSTTQAVGWGISKYYLKMLVREEKLEKLTRGIYRLVQSDISEEDDYRSATLRVGTPSTICLLSALVYYNLTDTIPKKTWIMVPTAKRTAYKDVKVFRKRNPQWEIGIEKQEGYWVTSLERTIVECLMYRSLLGSQMGLEALKRAVADKKTTLGKIMDMATKLKVSHRIQAYVEALI